MGDTDHTGRDVAIWTRKGNGLGLKRSDFPKKKTGTGSGRKERFAARKAVLVKIWPRLVAEVAAFQKRRRNSRS